MGAGYKHEDRDYVAPVERTEIEREFGPGFYWSAWQLSKFATFGSTIHMVSNCETVTDWDISSASNFNCVAGTPDLRTGSDSLELDSLTTTLGSTLTLDTNHRPDREDWTEFNWLCMWVHDDTAARLADELTVQIRNNGDWCTALSVPVNANVDVYEIKCIDISGIDRGCVDGFRFVDQRSSASSEKVYIDSIFVTDLITGEGSNTEIAAGPVYGPVRPIKVATGQTMVPGCGINWEACEGHLAAADDTAVVGICCQTTDFATRAGSDSNPKYVLAACSGAVVYCMNVGATVLGDGCLVGTGALGVTDANTAVTKVFCRALETGTDNAHTAYQLQLITQNV